LCDQRPGLRTVIFAPADGGIASLAGLKGHSLLIRDQTLYPVSFAFEQLSNAGLCAEDVPCSVLVASRPGRGEQKAYVKKTRAGYFGQNSDTVKAVLDEKSFDAGVALEWQLVNYQEGRQWRRLVTFHTPEFLWVSGPKTDASARNGFGHALLQFKNPKELESMLLDTDTDGFAFTNATDKLLEATRAAEQAQVRFEQCQPPRNGAAPGILPVSEVPRRSMPNKN
jgi:hypothetical protein